MKRRVWLFVATLFAKQVRPKMKEGIFVGPQTAQPFENKDFNTKLNSTQTGA
jgi:hypothetical protein